jgi:putative transposase
MASLARKTARLRFGRLSAAGANYFVTFCTKGRTCVLANPDNAGALIEVLRSMHEARDLELHAASIMPDHVHLLFALGARLGVGQVIGKIKSTSRRRTGYGWLWQDESFEHQVRLSDSIEDYAFYIFMNPYRSNLCRLNEMWPWWICPKSTHFRFLSHLEGGRPVPREWIGLSEHIGRRIVVRG